MKRQPQNAPACGFALLGFPCLSKIPISQASGSSSVEGAVLLAMVRVLLGRCTVLIQLLSRLIFSHITQEVPVDGETFY